MRLEPETIKIGEDEVTYFPVISSPACKALHEVIGEVVVEFGRLEFMIKAYIEKLNREISRVYLSSERLSFSEGMIQAEKEYTYSKCCVLLGKLFEKWHRDPQVVRAFGVLVAHLQDIGEERNAMFHGCWSESEDGTFIRLRSRYDTKTKSLYQAAERFTLNDLDDFVRLVNHRRFLLAASIGFDIGLALPVVAPVPARKPARGAVLIADLLVIADLLQIPREVLVAAVGLTEDVEDVITERHEIDIRGVVYGRASVLTRVLQRLLAVQEGDVEEARRWLTTVHERLGTTPVAAMQTVEGLQKLAALPPDI